MSLPVGELLKWGELIAQVVPRALDLVQALRRVNDGEDARVLLAEYAQRAVADDLEMVRLDTLVRLTEHEIDNMRRAERLRADVAATVTAGQLAVDAGISERAARELLTRYEVVPRLELAPDTERPTP